MEDGKSRKPAAGGIDFRGWHEAMLASDAFAASMAGIPSARAPKLLSTRAPIRVLVFCLIKERDRFHFVFDESPASLRALLGTFGVFASDPDLDFTWYDAALLSARVREAQTAGEL
jgi:hypothetical protein